MGGYQKQLGIEEPSVSRSTTDCVQMLRPLTRKGTAQPMPIVLILSTGDEIGKFCSHRRMSSSRSSTLRYGRHSIFHNLDAVEGTLTYREETRNNSNPATHKEWTRYGRGWADLSSARERRRSGLCAGNGIWNDLVGWGKCGRAPIFIKVFLREG